MTPMRFPFLVALVLASAGCSVLPAPPAPPGYLVLVAAEELPEAPPAAPRAASHEGALTLGLGPITLPAYLLRGELVAREGTRLLPSPTERWAEPLELGVERVLGADLRRALGVGPLVAHPWYATEQPDVQVELVFARLERDQSGNAVADAAWTIRRLDGDARTVEGRSVVEYPVAADGAATALALSRALADIADEIARAWPQE
jgi:uncharacterized lipoprotein YmbA